MIWPTNSSTVGAYSQRPRAPQRVMTSPQPDLMRGDPTTSQNPYLVGLMNLMVSRWQQSQMGQMGQMGQMPRAQGPQLSGRQYGARAVPMRPSVPRWNLMFNTNPNMRVSAQGPRPPVMNRSFGDPNLGDPVLSPDLQAKYDRDRRPNLVNQF